ncbi:hypothetical protein PRIPAC_81754 [Pristionchus pacificus]|uniref:Lipase n=1 Tax=Pristionchus pacificus TaxID=54126 RepID=A0A2A6CNI0_PRIPA|nr:hypothetical protein PRIPAC_81754 [Pristionchus pacificus]|eukprot:PDM79660.1 lipase [Pristionchus pacificus]
MSADRRPISDYTITVVCYTIGGLSLIISVCCLIFARRLQPSCTKGVFAILVLLQILYTLHNFHFSVLFIPFLYIEVGGGYCIGLMCEPHHLDFATNVIILMFLTGYLRSMFFLLVFVQHQRLLDAFVGISIIVGGNILPLKYTSLHLRASKHSVNLTLEKFRHTADWVEHNRNFGVIPKEDGDNLTHVMAFISAIYSLFAVVCSIHIVSPDVGLNNRANATVANFVAFITVPIALMMSMSFRHLEDDSIVFLPGIFLSSLSSISHSLLTLAHSPLIKARKLSLSTSERAVHAYTGRRVDVVAFSMGVPISRKAIRGGHCVENNHYIGAPITDKMGTYVGVAGPNKGVAPVLMGIPYALCAISPLIPVCNPVDGLFSGFCPFKSRFIDDINRSSRYEGQRIYTIGSTMDEVVGHYVCTEVTTRIKGQNGERIFKDKKHDPTFRSSFDTQLAMLNGWPF